MAERTTFWASHSNLAELKDKAMVYAKCVEHRARLLEKCPRISTGCPTQKIKLKGLIRAWDPTKSLQNQLFDEILIDLDFDKETIKLYREAARSFVKFTEGREGIPKVVQFAALEIKFMYGCDVEWNSGGDPAAPAALCAPAAAGKENEAASTADKDSSTGDAAPSTQGTEAVPPPAAALPPAVPPAAAALPPAVPPPAAASPTAVPPRATASKAALSDGDSSSSDSSAYSENADRGGDRIVHFQYIDPEAIMDTDWPDFKYPVAKHFIPRFRESFAVALLVFFDEALNAKFPNLCGQVHDGWRAHFNCAMQLKDILETPTTGENAYEEDEVNWMYQTARFYLGKMSRNDIETRGIDSKLARKILNPNPVRKHKTLRFRVSLTSVTGAGAFRARTASCAERVRDQDKRKGT